MPQKIFISYAHIDNEPLIKGEMGWVDHFDFAFEKLLRMHGGGKVELWRDPTLSRMGFFGEEINGALQQSAILVSIFSPSYFDSEWCMKELTTFINNWIIKHGESKAPPVVKVVKIPVDRKRYPEPLQRMLESF